MKRDSYSYTATYEPAVICGERGYAYECYVGARLIFQGWSRGHRRNAEAEVRNGIDARETLHTVDAKKRQRIPIVRDASLADRFDAIDWEGVIAKEMSR